MTGVVRAELRKLSKRTATWVITALLVLLLVGLSYALVPLVIAEAAEQSDPAELRAVALPQNLPPTLYQFASNNAVPFVFVLGALALGSEYRWRTLRVALVQRPGRAAVVAGKLMAVAVVVAALVLGLAVLAGIASVAVSPAIEQSAVAPELGASLEALGGSWLILFTFAALGMAVAALTRSPAVTIGLGLGYLLLVEPILLALPIDASGWDRFTAALPNNAAATLSADESSLAVGFGAGGGGSELLSPEGAAVVIGAYLVLAAGIAVLAVARRAPN